MTTRLPKENLFAYTHSGAGTAGCAGSVPLSGVSFDSVGGLGSSNLVTVSCGSHREAKNLFGDRTSLEESLLHSIR